MIHVCDLVTCGGCAVAPYRGGAAAGLRCDLVLRARAILSQASRDVTYATAARGLSAFVSFGEFVESPVLPASAQDVLMYVAYALEYREPRLDSSTVGTYLNGVSLWHELARDVTGLPLVNPVKTKPVRLAMRVAARYYKRPSRAMVPIAIREWARVCAVGFAGTRAGKHQRLSFVLCTFGPLRPGASARLVVRYRVAASGAVVFLPGSQVEVVRGDVAHPHPYIRLTVLRDKNMDARRAHVCYIPSRVLGVRPVRLLEEYLRTVRPPSGGYLLVAPRGRAGFHRTPYRSHCRAFRAAYRRALPGGTVGLSRVGGGTPRKSMAQWLWDAGHSKRVIADVGGWRTREDAVDGYFRTQGAAVLRILRALRVLV